MKIPHYGAPPGRAVTYRKVVDLSPAMFRAGALFICFKGWITRLKSACERHAGRQAHTGFFAPFGSTSRTGRPGKNTFVKVVATTDDQQFVGRRERAR